MFNFFKMTIAWIVLGLILTHVNATEGLCELNFELPEVKNCFAAKVALLCNNRSAELFRTTNAYWCVWFSDASTLNEYKKYCGI